MPLTSSEKRNKIRDAAAKHADEVLKNEVVDYAQTELAMNLHRKRSDMFAYGLSKIAAYSAQISAVIAWGIDPKILQYEDEFSDEVIDKAYETLADLNLVPAEV